MSEDRDHEWDLTDALQPSNGSDVVEISWSCTRGCGKTCVTVNSVTLPDEMGECV